MANDSRTLFQSFTKRGISDRDAIFAVIDHWNNLHWYDRNRYHERIKVLEEGNVAMRGEIAELRVRLAALEKPGA